MKATLDFSIRYADGEVSKLPIQQAIVHKNPLMDKKGMHVSIIRLWQQRCILADAMPMERTQRDLSNELSFTKIN